MDSPVRQQFKVIMDSPVRQQFRVVMDFQYDVQGLSRLHSNPPPQSKPSIPSLFPRDRCFRLTFTFAPSQSGLSHLIM